MAHVCLHLILQCLNSTPGSGADSSFLENTLGEAAGDNSRSWVPTIPMGDLEGVPTV